MTTGRGNFDRRGRPQTLQGDVVDIRNRLEQTVQFGVVEEVDYEKSKYRVRLSPTRLSNWITAATGGADAGVVNSNPLQIGAQVAVLSPSGNAEQGFILPGVYRNDHQRFDQSGNVYGNKFEDGTEVTFNKDTKQYDIKIPSGQANIQVGSSQIVITDGAIELRAGGSVLRFDGTLSHDGVVIDKTHKHVSAPPGVPGVPLGG